MQRILCILYALSKHRRFLRWLFAYRGGKRFISSIYPATPVLARLHNGKCQSPILRLSESHSASGSSHGGVHKSLRAEGRTRVREGLLRMVGSRKLANR